MNTDKVRERFDRIEGYIDYLYDATYGAADAFFFGVDYVYDALKKRALQHATRATGTPPQTPVEKAYALADYYENNGKPNMAYVLRSRADKGMVDINLVESLWDGINPDDPRVS